MSQQKNRRNFFKKCSIVLGVGLMLGLTAQSSEAMLLIDVMPPQNNGVQSAPWNHPTPPGPKGFNDYQNNGYSNPYGMGHPGMGHPGMGHPGMGHPGMGHPGMGHPGMGHPGMGHPGMGHPGMGHPGMGQGYQPRPNGTIVWY